MSHPPVPQPRLVAGAAILLAAGQGRRFGGAKLLAPFRGAPLVAGPLAVLGGLRREGVLTRAVAVVPARDETLGRLVRDAGLVPVSNPDSDSTLGDSLRLGLAAVTGSPWALIALADQPLPRRDVILALLAQCAVNPDAIIRPRYAGAPDRPGHPVLVPAAYWRHATGAHGFPPGTIAGARYLEVMVDGANPDVDTPDDLRALERPAP